MNIDSEKIHNMKVDDIVALLAQEDDFLIENTLPISKIEDIRDQLLIQYNKLTNSNIMTNAQMSNI
jgi:hypothetical protein